MVDKNEIRRMLEEQLDLFQAWVEDAAFEDEVCGPNSFLDWLATGDCFPEEHYTQDDEELEAAAEEEDALAADEAAEIEQAIKDGRYIEEDDVKTVW